MMKSNLKGIKKSMNKNHEILWKNFSGKTKDGYGTIIVKFGEICVPVLAKPVLDEDMMDLLEDEELSSECKCLNVTKWEYKPHPAVKSIRGCNVFGTAVLYYNSLGDAWKFYDDDARWIELASSQSEKLEQIIESIEENEDWWKIYEPHNGNEGNCGDEPVHAVYTDMSGSLDLSKKTKLDAAAEIAEEAKETINKIVDDLEKKKIRHQKMTIDEDLLNDLKDLMFELEYI